MKLSPDAKSTLMFLTLLYLLSAVVRDFIWVVDELTDYTIEDGQR